MPEEKILELKNEASIKYIAIQKSITWNELGNLINDEDNNNIISEVVTKDYFEIYPEIKEKLIRGRIINEMDEDNEMAVCLIREDMAYYFFNNIDDCIGEKIIFNNQEIKVIGILKSNENEYEFPYISNIYISERFVANSNDIEINGITNFIIKPISNEGRNDAISKVENFLNEYISSEDYYIEQFYVSGENASIQIIDIISTVFLIIASISIISGGIGIMNVLLVSVNERIREIGIRRAIGAKKKNIFLQFTIEGICLIMVSGILAIISAIALITIGNTFCKTNNFTLYIDLKIIFKVFVLCSNIGIVFSLYPAIKASRLNPADALRN